MATELGTENQVKTAEQIRQELEQVSPLALTQTLIDYEIADMQSSLKIIDDIHKEFEGGPGLLKTMAEPVVCSLVDASLRVAGKQMINRKFGKEKKSPIKKNYAEEMQKKAGFTSSRILEEIRRFKYPNRNTSKVSDTAYLDLTDHGYDRAHLENKAAMGRYKSDKFGRQEGKAVYKKNRREGTVACEYESGTELYFDKNAAKTAGVVNTKDHVATTDHVVPLKQVSYLMSKHVTTADQKELANKDYNFRLMSQSDNSSKNAQTAKAYAGKKAKTPENRKSLELAQRTAERKLLSDATVKATQNKVSSTIIPAIVVPLGFEIYEMLTKGVCHELQTDNLIEGLGHRLKRVGSYLAKRLPELWDEFLKDFWEVVKDVIATMIAKFFERFKSIIVQGFNIFLEALKIISKPSSEISNAEKCDALVKICAGPLSVLIIDNVVFVALEGLGLPDWLNEIISAVAASVLSTFVLYGLDKIDLFSVKGEKRLARVREIFDLRIKHIRESTRNFDIAVHETLKANRIRFEELRGNIAEALEKKDMHTLNITLDQTADFFKVDIPYSSPQEFIQFIRANERILVGA